MTREERRVYQQEWRKANLDKVRGYYEARKNDHNAYSRAWAKRNPEKVWHSQTCWRRANRKRVSEIQAKSRANKSDARKLLDRTLRRIHKFGLTLNQYLDLLITQDFLCAVCRQPALPNSHNGRRSLDGFVVDHNHATKRVRGLLHPNCNVAIGLMQDSPSMLRQAARYLENQENGDL